jgi:protein-tyrosine phosphatase
MDYILKNLAIGEFRDALEPDEEISALLCVAQEHAIRNPSLFYHKVPIIDMQPIPLGQLKEAVFWIRDAIQDGYCVLVFCNAGVGRSPSVVIAYLCTFLGHSFGKAVEHVATKRPGISMLPNLITSIKEIQKHL